MIVIMLVCCTRTLAIILPSKIKGSTEVTMLSATVVTNEDTKPFKASLPSIALASLGITRLSVSRLKRDDKIVTGTNQKMTSAIVIAQTIISRIIRSRPRMATLDHKTSLGS